MKVSTETNNEYTIVAVKGTLSIENISPFETILKNQIEDNKHIIVNLEDLSFIDSSSLGIIVVYFAKSEKNNKSFALANVNRDIMQMFKITGLDKRVKIFDSIESALTNLNLN